MSVTSQPLTMALLAPLLKAYWAKYPSQSGGIPPLEALQCVRCEKEDCFNPKKDDAAWCVEHTPTYPPEVIPIGDEQDYEYCEPRSKCIYPSAQRCAGHLKKAAAARILKEEDDYIPVKKPTRRRLEYDEEMPPPPPRKHTRYANAKEPKPTLVHDINSVFFNQVHTRYEGDSRWLRRPAPDSQVITNNLRTVEVHLQCLAEQQDHLEQDLRNKIAVLGERQSELNKKCEQFVESLNRVDETIDGIQAQVTDVLKLVKEFMDKQK